MFYVFDIEGFLVDKLATKSATLSKYSVNKIKLQDVLINNASGIISFTGPSSSVGRVSASGNGRSRVRSRDILKL